jgi:hypothetical protein
MVMRDPDATDIPLLMTPFTPLVTSLSVIGRAMLATGFNWFDVS